MHETPDLFIPVLPDLPDLPDLFIPDLFISEQ
jgi:hypothetical protein